MIICIVVGDETQVHHIHIFFFWCPSFTSCLVMTTPDSQNRKIFCQESHDTNVNLSWGISPVCHPNSKYFQMLFIYFADLLPASQPKCFLQWKHLLTGLSIWVERWCVCMFLYVCVCSYMYVCFCLFACLHGVMYLELGDWDSCLCTAKRGMQMTHLLGVQCL